MRALYSPLKNRCRGFLHSTTRLAILTSLIVWTFSALTYGQTVVTVGGGVTITCPATPTATWTTPPTGVSFSNWSRGTGVSCSSASDGLSGSGFNTADFNASFTGNKFYKVTLTADATHGFTLTNINWLATVSSGGTGTANFTVGYINNGGSFTTIGATSQSGSGSAISLTFTGSVVVTPGTSLEVFLIPSNTSASGSTVRFKNGSTFTITACTVPSTLSYSTNPATYCEDELITDNTPTVNGTGPYSYNVFPSLPDGLVLDNTSGVISGTPTAPTIATGYSVSVTNACGTTSTVVNIEVESCGCPDADEDTICDDDDNCPSLSNTDQTDSDMDGVGNACDNCSNDPNPLQANADGDIWGDACDNCPNLSQSNQFDADNDGLGDACDPDDDNDGVADEMDNCPFTVNGDQVDTDLDGLGNACDPDDDDDGIVDGMDNCPLDENVDQTDNDGDGLGNPCDNCANFGLNPDQTDTDGDAIGDLCDNCVNVSNEDQTDTDDDGIGDDCDTCTDVDGDGVGDAGFNNTTCAVSNGPDNCPYIPNPDQIDSDGDGTGDQCELCTFPAAPESGDSDADGIGDECDNCPEEPNAIQVDTDSDLTGDACDGCPFDPNKIAPGLCGCGVVDSETDTDGDFTPDCNDGCPNDPMKINPGTCGCGNSEPGTPCDDGNAGTIMDAIDGSCNCVGVPAECMVNGDCPPTDADPCTIEVCGGGMCQTVTLPDTDGDGACDAIDGCPNDPNKTSGGFCGCGNPETGDSDGDGAPDCVDGCPMDPNKVAPGVCGCGVADTDGDGDGTPDCNDGCPMDPDKTTPGECGCDVADTDTDGDGFVDCIDGCPFNPDLIVPGICGCSTDDVDNDGVLDCVDACPLNPDLIELTVCGDCTIPIDTDGDGFMDCIDGCPNDPNKVAAGVCGCGVADTDTDEDGTADCVDGCPMDPNKTTPGECGCGVADTDTDEDGTADCNDGCPMDPNKVAAGVCGCGVADTDGDGDGTADCDDDCPMDPDKIAPGVCGCGVADTDGDGDGTADCDDDCPMDPNKITPGVCGCGVADTDGDGDGTADCDDLCPAGPEPGTPCDDGSACTENDVIQSDCSCAGTPVTCDDGNPCTSTECDPMVGCLFISYDTDEDGVCDALDMCPAGPEPGTPCDDGSACTENDVIQSDCSCAGTPVTCDDGNPCTSTECDPMVGCLFISYDIDEDGICDEFDNCPDDANADQTDSDGDGLGDACDECPYAVDGIENFDEENCRCNQGYYAVTGGIGDLTGSGSRGAVPVTITGCQPCQPGYYCPDGLGAYPCPVNTYIDLQAAVVCLPCAEGYTSQQGSVACELIANCDDGIMNGDEDGVDCGGTNCAPCSPPNAVCGVITVYVNPNIYDYDGPGSQNIWLIDSSYLDAGSTYDSEEPSIKVKRYLSNITFNWTTNGACIDESPNGVINNPDKGIVYRSCYPAIPADLNKNKLYRLLISDDFGSDECSGTVKVIQQSGAFTAPSVHFVIPDNEEYISIARPQFQLLDGDASIVSDLIAIPNPGSHSLHLRWNAETSGDIEIRVIDMSGRLAVLQPYEVISGQNMVMFDMSAQPSGMYAILIQTGTEVISTKWFKD